MTAQESESLSVEGLIRKFKPTRLAHFTPSLNLPHILRDGLIRSSKELAEEYPGYFSPTDKIRLDGHPDKVCCTIQYPNPYYLSKAKKKSEFVNYPDWVCLFIDIELILEDDVLFAPCNAARQTGALLQPGAAGLEALYEPVCDGWARGTHHHPSCPTNLQAEVLIPGPISLQRVHTVAVPSEEHARSESSRLRLLGLDPAVVNWTVAPMLFDRNGLVSDIKSGGVIIESPWHPGQLGGAP